MNIFNSIIIYLLFMILCKVSYIKTMNNSRNKEKKIRLLEDTTKKNSIFISIETKSEGYYAYIYINYFNNYFKPTELYLNNTNISVNSYQINLKPGNHSIEIVFDNLIITNCRGMFYGCPIKYIDLSNFNTSKVTDMANMFYECYFTIIRFI